MTVVLRRSVVEVTGRDAVTFLQGQLSNAVAELTPGGSCWAFLLEPSGKLGFLVRARRSADEQIVLDTEPGQADAVVTRLRRFLIRTKAQIETAADIAVGVGSSDVRSDPPVQLVGWWNVGVHEVLGTAGPSVRISSDVDIVAARVAAGWPGGLDLQEGAIPGETGVVPVAVSFTKGCYTGQELVARIDSRGNNVPRHLRRLALGAPAHAGDELVLDGTVVGELTTVAGSAALGYVRRAVEPGSSVLVAGIPAVVHEAGPPSADA